MLFWLLLLFILVPFIELVILIFLGDHIGFWPTFALIVLMGIVGFLMVRSQGFSVIQRIKADVFAGAPPAQALIDGLLVFAGGLLLITPGLITDIVGLLLLFPMSRIKISKILTPWVLDKIFKSGSKYFNKL